MKTLNSENFTKGQVEAQKKYGKTYIAKSLIDYPNNPQDTTRLWPGFKEFIENCAYFFMATSNAEGQCNCNFRGGGKGVVKVTDEKTLYFPDFAGNGLLHCTGDFFENPHIGILFINFRNRQRIKVNGSVEIIDDKTEMKDLKFNAMFSQAERIVKVNVEYAVLNCARFLDSIEEDLKWNT